MALDPAGVRVLLLDVEGTTTPVSFVSDVLFPFARQRVADFLGRRAGDPVVRDDLAALRSEHAAEAHAGQDPPPWSEADLPGSAVAFTRWLMDRDRKSTALKSLQGRIWEEGFRSGELRGEVYPDVPRAFARWRRQGRDVAIFSSGSVLAQRLLFGNTPFGDLTGHLRAHFDTSTGPKREAESYRRIATALAVLPGEVLFLSDLAAELDGARAAGMKTGLALRSGDRPPSGGHPAFGSFDEVLQAPC